MLSVDIEKIIPVTGARDMFNKIVDEVEGSDELYVLTKNGKPAAVVVGVNHLEKLTGETSGEIMTKVDQATEEPEDEEEAPKPFDTTATASADEPAETAITPATDAFSAAPTTEAPVTPSSSFNAAPAMPEETTTATSNIDPMAPVTDADGKEDTPAAAPASAPTPTTDPFAPSTTPAANAPGSHNPAPGTSSNTNATPPSKIN